MKKTTIKSIQSNGTWDSKFGLLYKFEVEMEDGTIGVSNAKSKTPPSEQGSTVWYDIKGENRYGNSLKITTSDPARQQQSQSSYTPQTSDTQTRIENSWAVQTAIQVYGSLPQTGYDLNTYLKKVNELAPALLEMRDNVSKLEVKQEDTTKPLPF